MARYELLNNIDHPDLRIIIDRSAEMGDDLWFAPTFPEEFRNVQRHYPIFFSKDAESGKIQALALFGVQQGENLFLNEKGWDAGYIPLDVMRQPFLIGFQDQQSQGGSGREPVISIDMDSPRVNSEHGERIFLEHGGNSPYIERIAGILNVLHDGFRRSEHFYDRLQQLNLLESFVVEAQLRDGSEHRMTGLHTINEDVLKSLDADTLADLHRRGYLEAIYMAIASVIHMADLIDRKEARRA